MEIKMYKVNQIFIDDENYPSIANWCNENNCYIEEIEPKEDGTRQFKIRQIPTKPLELSKSQKHSELKSIMQKKKSELTVPYDNDTFDANESAQDNMVTLLKAFDLGAETVQIRSSTEVTHTFNEQQCNELAMIMYGAVKTLFDKYWELKDALALCQNAEEVHEIVWE